MALTEKFSNLEIITKETILPIEGIAILPINIITISWQHELFISFGSLEFNKKNIKLSGITVNRMTAYEFIMFPPYLKAML